MNKYENLVKKLSDKYYTGNETVSDDVFDALVSKVKEDNSSSDILTTGFGFEVKGDKVKHKYCHVGSLKKAHDWKDIQNFMNGISDDTVYYNVDISAKLDGLSVVLYYKNSELVLALTRGNGTEGKDITNKVKKIINDHLLRTENFTGAVRAEILMSNSDFFNFKEIHPDAKNARNSAAGIINSDEITSDLKYISILPYSIIADEDKYTKYTRESSWAFLESNFTQVAPHVSIPITKIDYNTELEAYFDLWKEYLPLDGVVLTKRYLNREDNIIIQDSIAYKFQDEIKISQITSIEWTMSKNSRYVPVAVIEPIELEGTTVSRVSCFNAKYISDNNIHVGSIVAVCKKNQIIPYIVEVIKEEE